MITAVIKTKSLKILKDEIKKAKKADLIEIWFDELDINKIDLKALLKSIKKPVIYKYTGPAENIELVLSSGAAYIDLDLSTPKKTIENIKKNHQNTKIILSFHDFEKTPKTGTIESILKRMRQKGADISKVATLAKTFEDSLRLLAILSKQEEKTIIIGMGEKGKITRLTGHLLGNYLMYAATSNSTKTADGQLTIDEMQSLIKFK